MGHDSNYIFEVLLLQVVGVMRKLKSRKLLLVFELRLLDNHDCAVGMMGTVITDAA